MIIAPVSHSVIMFRHGCQLVIECRDFQFLEKRQFLGTVFLFLKRSLSRVGVYRKNCLKHFYCQSYFTCLYVTFSF